jgi:2-polyprenyl-6-methoxyphenol hydroxylase-like FAD-dependent oxidoreductase
MTIETYDVAIIGGRCAGSPLAALLARRGLRVIVLEQAAFPRDTLSTHVIQAPAAAFLEHELGLARQLKELGARYSNEVDFRLGDFSATMVAPLAPGDPGAFVSVRRFLLDPLLVEAAAAAGAEVRMGTKVTDVVRAADRVGGVRLADGTELRADLVVGADGRNSTVADLVGARKYNVIRSQRSGYWGFFEAPNAPESTAIAHTWDGNIVYGFPADSGLFQVIVLAATTDADTWRGDVETALVAYARRCPPMADALDGARLVGKITGARRWEGFLREATGPGWLLLGDAGHFKDPTPAWGMGDAFRQVEAVTPVIADAIDGAPRDLDQALRKWARWRDRTHASYHWFAGDLGRAGPTPIVIPEILRRYQAQGRLDHPNKLLQHRLAPPKVMTPARLVGATARLLLRPGTDRPHLLREVGTTMATDVRRRYRNRRPAYELGAATAATTEIR